MHSALKKGGRRIVHKIFKYSHGMLLILHFITILQKEFEFSLNSNVKSDNKNLAMGGNSKCNESSQCRKSEYHVDGC